MNTNDPYSQTTRKVADAYWRASLGKPQTFENDMKALAAALREVAAQCGYEVACEGWYELVVDARTLYMMADELDGKDG